MDGFTAKGALQAGFDLIRRRPWLVLLWAALFLALNLALATGLQEVMAIVRPSRFNLRASLASAGVLNSYVLAESVLQLVLNAVLWASAFRALLRPAGRGAVGFGGEELFVLGALFLPWLVSGFVSGPLLVALLIAHVPRDSWVLTATTEVIGILTLLWGSLAAVCAFERLQVTPFRCWRIVKGRFWLVAGLIVGVSVVQLLASDGIRLLTVELTHRFPLPLRTDPFLPRPADLAAAFRPPALTSQVLRALLKALDIAFVAGIAASAYRAGPAPPQAASFSTGSAAAPS